MSLQHDESDTTSDNSSGVLLRESVIVGEKSVSQEEAIEFAGRLLVERGVVTRAYIEGMKKREETVSTYLGNGVAMPHGTFDLRDAVRGTGIVVTQYPDGVAWGDGTAHLVVGLAATGEDHVQILSQLAEVLQDEELCQELWTTPSADRLYEVLSTVQDDDDDDDDDVTDEADGDTGTVRTVVITNPAGLHARPATVIVELVKASGHDVTIQKGDKTANAASIMSVLSLGATEGDEVTVSTSGGDAATAGETTAAVITILTTDERSL